MERRQHYKEWVTTEEEWSQGWLPGFWFWLPRGLTPPEVDNMGRAVGFKMGRVREKEMTVWFWFSEMWDSCGTSEWNCLKKCWRQNAKSYRLWEWSGVMKRGHGCEDHGKDIGRLGRDMEPNYGTRLCCLCLRRVPGTMERRAWCFQCIVLYESPRIRTLMVLKEKSGKR